VNLRTVLLAVILLSTVVLPDQNAVILPAFHNSRASNACSITAAPEPIVIPKLLSYQGRLTDSLGHPVPDGTYQLTFRLYTQETGGNPFWSETRNLEVQGGIFSTLLGLVTPLNEVPDDGNLYLSVQVGTCAELTPRLRIVSAAYAFTANRADTANYALSTSLEIPKTWVRGEPDSVLSTVNFLGLTRGRADNMLHGNERCTHVNFGVACTTGAPDRDYTYCGVAAGFGNRAVGNGAFVGGGYSNDAIADYATVAGGDTNTASGTYAVVGGGSGNTASSSRATVAGGRANTASGTNATVAGGKYNIARGYCAAVAGGIDNVASDNCTAIGGGSGNLAAASGATVAGGRGNTASGRGATIAGGELNLASGPGAAVAGGENDTAAGDHSFAAGYHSVVPAGFSNSAAFNGQTATASGQLRCGILSQTGGAITIDHPLDPCGKILNHYSIGGPEMRNIYEGSVILDSSGKAEVRLPDYFSALNRNPHIQLTGVGSYEVYVIEDITDNRFVIAGRPGTKVYWLVTGERQDISAELIRQLMPVEQHKTGSLTGRVLNDEFLAGCREQLKREGKTQKTDFCTAGDAQRCEQLKRQQLRPE